jgi:hypothetical protein
MLLTKNIKALIMAVAIILPSGNSYADSSLLDAIMHTQKAIDQGKLRYDLEFIKHAKLALKSATFSYRNMTASFSSSEADANAHKYKNIKFGIDELKVAIGDEKSFHIAEALVHAEKALQFFHSQSE